MRRPRSWALEIAMVVALVAWTVPLFWPSALVHFDIAVRDAADAHRTGFTHQFAVLTNMLGQGGALGGVALGIASIIAWRRRDVRPLLAFVTTYFMAGAVLVMKYTLLRVYPHWPDISQPPYADAAQAVLMTSLEPAGAYPSGHVLNAVVWYGFIVLMVGRSFAPWVRVLFLTLPPLIVAYSTTYLGFHWFSDTPAGLFIGVVIIRIVQRVPWGTVELPLWLEPERRYR
ncbi:phosphatase PAP2 family protein [Glycomyces paridis]|uniref:Phosphatase PAP2 family protein n=1 Tax=Glycomyces paridis TaxID=2126555 RepID=A0A4S8PUE8_9ACTN|nr:phosphatase PAP2 family protein [Glycomyces paridis]THV31959.1 phosphatase PAP2 family protein [Glycomyces paridis]